MGKFVDLTGQKFNRLTVIGRCDNPNKMGVTWLCRCDCGNETTAITNELKCGIKKSCGCYRSDWEQEKRNDIVGKKFNRLTVLRFTRRIGRKLYYECKCDCGNIVEVRKDSILNGHATSCGCRWEEVRCSPERGRTHGMTYTKHRAYRLWGKVKDRCYNPNAREYPNYGGRGIVMCDEWVNDAKAFIDWCYANGYDDKAPKGECTLDRIDVNGNYEPSNCRFITNLEQQNNRRDTYKHEYNGGMYTVAELARMLNVPYPTISAAIRGGKMSVEEFLADYHPRK